MIYQKEKENIFLLCVVDLGEHILILDDLWWYSLDVISFLWESFSVKMLYLHCSAIIAKSSDQRWKCNSLSLFIFFQKQPPLDIFTFFYICCKIGFESKDWPENLLPKSKQEIHFDPHGIIPQILQESTFWRWDAKIVRLIWLNSVLTCSQKEFRKLAWKSISEVSIRS